MLAAFNVDMEKWGRGGSPNGREAKKGVGIYYFAQLPYLCARPIETPNASNPPSNIQRKTHPPSIWARQRRAFLSSKFFIRPRTRPSTTRRRSIFLRCRNLMWRWRKGSVASLMRRKGLVQLRCPGPTLSMCPSYRNPIRFNILEKSATKPPVKYLNPAA